VTEQHRSTRRHAYSARRHEHQQIPAPEPTYGDAVVVAGTKYRLGDVVSGKPGWRFAHVAGPNWRRQSPVGTIILAPLEWDRVAGVWRDRAMPWPEPVPA
jgi:hypothetical protein